MAARKYEIFPQVLKNTSEIFFNTRREVSYLQAAHAMLYLLYKHQRNTKSFHFIVFWCERRELLCSQSNGDISRVKISSFRAKGHMVFHWRLYN